MTLSRDTQRLKNESSLQSDCGWGIVHTRKQFFDNVLQSSGFSAFRGIHRWAHGQVQIS